MVEVDSRPSGSVALMNFSHAPTALHVVSDGQQPNWQQIVPRHRFSYSEQDARGKKSMVAHLLRTSYVGHQEFDSRSARKSLTRSGLDTSILPQHTWAT
jgi:hypothetical protein